MIVIIGSGMTGLACARRLAEAGLSPVVLDKGRGIGGRVATRRVSDLQFDHGTHHPARFIKPAELRTAMQGAGLVPGLFTGLGPRGLNRRRDLTFGPLPLTAILSMGTARKPVFEARK